MAVSDHSPRNGLVRFLRKIYNPIGFKKGYNALLWFIFDGALLGFLLARLGYLSFYGIFCSTDPSNTQLHAGPGECYYYLNFDRYRIGIQLHLYCIIPAGFLAVLQFVPVIRYKALLYHRLAGYLAVLLVMISNAGALMIADRSFGGSASTQALVGMLAILTVVGFSLAIYNIKKLQIDQHRAWMLRTWSYMGSIITIRFILPAAGAIGAMWSYETLRVSLPCDKILNIYTGNTELVYSLYPTCDPANALSRSTDGYAVVVANFNSSDPVEIAASFLAYFGMAGWLGLAMHAFLVELYLQLTPAESERLRQVSYEKQIEKGWKDAGYSGLVAQRLGDATPFHPTEKHPTLHEIPVVDPASESDSLK